MEFFFPKNIKLFLNLILAANLIVLIGYVVESRVQYSTEY